MGDVPYPITAESTEDLRAQIFELIRQIFEEKIGGADLGDVFSIVGDVLTLALATPSGLTKEGNVLSIEVTDDGGLQLSTDGIIIKIVSTGGLETNASGLQIKLDGDSLSTSASGLKVNANLIDVGVLAASRLLYTDAAKKFQSVTNLQSWIAGTAGQINIANDGDGTVTISLLAPTINTWTTDQVLTNAQLNQIHIFNSALDLECTLPSVTSSDIGKWVIIVKAGTGDLTINANGTNTILDSDPGGRIECTNNDYDYQKMGLRLFMTTAWHSGPECFGVWSTR